MPFENTFFKLKSEPQLINQFKTYKLGIINMSLSRLECPLNFIQTCSKLSNQVFVVYFKNK